MCRDSMAFHSDLKSVLQHLIVSHHGEIDKGALRQPAFPEAFVLHYLDEIDARLEQAWRLIDQGPAGEEWTAVRAFAWAPIISTVSAGTGSRPEDSGGARQRSGLWLRGPKLWSAPTGSGDGKSESVVARAQDSRIHLRSARFPGDRDLR